MLSFYPAALRRDAARTGVKSLAFDLVVPVLAAVLATASVWAVAGNGPVLGLDKAAHQGIEDAKPHTSAHPIRAS